MKNHTIPNVLGLIVAAMIGTATAGNTDVVRVDNNIPGRYIVVLNHEALPTMEIAAHRAMTVREQARGLAERFGRRPGRSFSHALKGFVIELDEDAAEVLADHPSVDYVVEDGVAWTVGVQMDPPSWGLDRIDQLTSTLDGRYVYYGDGTGVNLYVIDSGVRSTHTDLSGRVDTVNAFTAVDDGLGTEDGFGHGTAVAALAAGTAYGVAKAALIHPVRVLGADGSGSISDVIAGIDWVTANYQAPAVANISINAAAHPALDAALQASINAGVFYTVASSNANSDACLASPSRVQSAFVVGASNGADERAWFSDYGSCLDIFAPGVDVVTAWARDDTDAVLTSGVSYAAPLVAGTAALYLQQFPSAPTYEVSWAILNSANSVVPDDGTGSPTELIYSAFVGDGIDQPPYATFSASCSGRRCSFDGSASTDDNRIVSFSWDFGDGQVANNKKGSKIGHRFPDVGDAFTVTLTVKDDAGQMSDYQREIRFSSSPPSDDPPDQPEDPPDQPEPPTQTDEPPTATFTAKCRANRCSFNAGGSTDDYGIVSYDWDFGDGAVATGNTGSKIAHRYPKSGGAFTVTLRVTDTAGQTAEAQQGIDIP